jgi:hypothetical protein
MGILVLRVQPSRKGVRSCVIQRGDSSDSTLWYRLPESAPEPREGDAEPYVVALVMQAMLERRTLIIKDGAVTRELLSNLTEFRDAWVSWCPDKYSRIEFEPYTIEDRAQRGPRAVAAFSGGVDGTFSVWRHTHKTAGYRAQDIKYAAVVHGFDIPLRDVAAFSAVMASATPRLARLGVQAVPVATNFSHLSTVAGSHVFGPAVASVLWQFAGECGTGILGSSHPYRHLLLAWGSNPITDPLLASSEFRITLDGAALSRAEKVKELARWPEAVSDLRVCWEGVAKDRNCGKCEKCLRTMLIFRTFGHPIPSCFPSLSLDALKTVVVPDRYLWQWQRLLVEAAENGIRDEWVGVVRAKLSRDRFRSRVASVLPAPVKKPIRRLLRSLRVRHRPIQTLNLDPVSP